MKEKVSKLTYPTLQHCVTMLHINNGNAMHLWLVIIGHTELINNCHICVTFGCSLPKRYRPQQLLRHSMNMWLYAKLVSYKLHEIVCFGQSSDSSLRKKSNQYFQWIGLYTITTFHDFLLGTFRGVALTNWFSSIFNFGQISKFKRGITLRKKIQSEFPVNMHIYTLRPL